jgi:F0F1-type ATP synthase delta subunit
MITATDYARALYAAAEEHPQKGTELLKNLRALLGRRGHGKLLPRILTEYEKLFLREARGKRYASVTSEQKRTRVLLELYRKLTHSH